MFIRRPGRKAMRQELR